LSLPVHWKVLAGLGASAVAGLLVVVCLPRLEPSAVNVKAVVEQPVFVTPLPAPSAPKGSASSQPFGKDALVKLAKALRAQPAAFQKEDAAMSKPNATLAIPIEEARRLCAEGLVAFARGDIATAREFFLSAAQAGDARALVALGDTFDPATLARLGVVGLKGDGVKARDYYARALAAGAEGARERIASLATQ